jgi:hypothetical protein
MSALDDVIRRNEEKMKKVADFGELLDSMASVDDKRKLLWKEIYQNAVTDRENAYILYIGLYQTMSGSPADHAAHGSTLMKYMERMSKANDQIIKLAEMIRSTEEESQAIDSEDIFSKISKE